MKPSRKDWTRFHNVAHILFFLVLIPNFLAIRPFSPRQILFACRPWPLFTAPWAGPTSPASFLSSIFQAYLVWYIPSSAWTIPHLYVTWLAVALLRTGVGFIFSRAVGWAYPFLFSHFSVYEEIRGFGPALVSYMYFVGVPTPVKSMARSVNAKFEISEPLLLCGLSILLCFLDGAWWTYGVAVAFGFSGWCCAAFWPLSSRGLTMEGEPRSTRLGPSLTVTITTLLVFIVCQSVATSLETHGRNSTMPKSSFNNSPLLELLVLTYPRPATIFNDSPSVLQTTIDSYLPFLSNDIHLSVFTHAITHPDFEVVRQKTTPRPEITFFMDRDAHPDSQNGHYLHIAEALRWVMEKKEHPEWVMLLEDDFPLCYGAEGWGAVAKVMNALEGAREKGEDGSMKLSRKAGMVGTGGSGLIIHRSLLPILVLSLRQYASHELTSSLPQDVYRRPPDVIIQDCLLGIDPLCPQYQPKIKEVWLNKGEGSLVITSRLIMDHIGGQISTTMGKPGNSDKWRCRWRHAFHGREEVMVVVV